MPIQPHQVTSRANSDLTTIDMISNDVAMSPAARMALITEVADAYRAAVKGSTKDPYRNVPTVAAYLADRVNRRNS